MSTKIVYIIKQWLKQVYHLLLFPAPFSKVFIVVAEILFLQASTAIK
ncbi:hypothetical protein RG47T_1544 [Mucilaginibacter polytrichastri]|uniref:Uncharacterized protein n=1 Tax=Mucilaginibacter polytrichastri TaxID=1302689 RepID=A0A1Q5ZWD9_9SPHI|nr:hypothetical protein RG47T_1544 [Mucilaginibacter polytrichastri]